MADPRPGTAGERVLKELHAELALRRKLREPKIAAQLVAPDLRIDLGADRLAPELEREVGADAAAWLALLGPRQRDRAAARSRCSSSEHAFPGVGFFEQREVARLDRARRRGRARVVDRRRARSARRAVAPARRDRAPPPGAGADRDRARGRSAWRTGPPALRGDGDAIRDLLAEKLTTAGGEIRAGRVAELGVSWGKVTSLTLQNGDEIGAGQVVSSRSPRELAELLGKKAPKRLAELAEAIALVGYRYTLNIVLDEAGLPEHMAPTVAVIAAPDREPVGDAAFSIHLGETDDAGRVVATVAAILASDGPLDPDRLPAKSTALRSALWQRLGDVMPFFERHLVLAHSPFEATPPQAPGGRGSYDVPRNLPLAMAPVWRGQLAQTADTGAAALHDRRSRT